ncbi:MAG: type II toxin-antitoxin system RelE/ParE family toxin [Blastomonas sp.]|nr:type II toxin-antitoxin system RelE/ParE family toxin [Blastomonas sp.]
MKTLRLIWSDEALDDVREIIDYIAQRNVRAALRLEQAMHACAERLTNHPQMYRSGRAPDTREAVVHPNYLIIYRVEEHEIVIANVVHARQQYP